MLFTSTYFIDSFIVCIMYQTAWLLHTLYIFYENIFQEMKSLLLIATIVSFAVCCHGDEDFIDPFDMENFDPVTKTMIKVF